MIISSTQEAVMTAARNQCSYTINLQNTIKNSVHQTEVEVVENESTTSYARRVKLRAKHQTLPQIRNRRLHYILLSRISALRATTTKTGSKRWHRPNVHNFKKQLTILSRDVLNLLRQSTYKDPTKLQHIPTGHHASTMTSKCEINAMNTKQVQ